MQPQNKHVNNNSMCFNFFIRRPILLAPLGRIFAISAELVGICTFEFLESTYWHNGSFLNNVLREINTFSSRLSLNSTSGTGKMTNFFQTACAGVFCFGIFLSQL